MTDYSTMTDEQVNEAIAVKRGFFYGKVPGYLMGYEVYYYIDNGNVVVMPSIDYTHSWELCGELLEEMKSADVDLMYFKTLNKWGVDWLDNDEVEHQCVADTPLRAICEAWLPWREQ